MWLAGARRHASGRFGRFDCGADAARLWLNRLANLFIRVLFGIRLNDTTNAFKAYRRNVIEGCKPILSPHFNLTVELPLKTIVRGYTWTIVPITWRNRRTGTAKLKLKKMGRWRISPWRWTSTHPHRWSQCDPRCFQAPATRS